MNLRTILAIFLGFAAVTLSIAVYVFYKNITIPLSTIDTRDTRVLIEIKKGSSLNQISSHLYQTRLIRDPRLFTLLTIVRGAVNKLKAGEYQLSPAMSSLEILNKIIKGQVVQHAVTIPEGLNIYEIGALLEKHNITRKESFIANAFKPEVVKSLGFNSNSMEGYLFPDTYYFKKNISDYDILKKMAVVFKKKVMAPEIMTEVDKSNLSFHEIVTLASLIEKETGKGKERPLISAVFHNRLKKRMRLQCDPTVIYAIKNFDGNIRKKDLEIDSPYNTYRYPGLPPGPIANPGLWSIKTALHPADVNYLYFVSKKNGEHKFSSTLKEHNQAVLKYQLRRRRKAVTRS